MGAEGNRTVARCLTLAAIALALLGAGVAIAQKGASLPVMTAAELKSSLFGINMDGVAGSGFRWSECIDPKGQTLYRTPGGEMHGRLTISAQGQACFAYEDDGFATPQCFLTRRAKDGFRFEGDFGTIFITTKVVRGVRTCDKDDLVG